MVFDFILFAAETMKKKKKGFRTIVEEDIPSLLKSAHSKIAWDKKIQVRWARRIKSHCTYVMVYHMSSF